MTCCCSNFSCRARPKNVFNVGGADPLGRTGQSTKGPSHLIKVSIESALSLRLRVDVFGTDYLTPDGTCI